MAGILFVAFRLSHKAFFTKLGARLNKATVITPDIIRIAFGASLLFSVSHGALYGPELPLHDLAGGHIIQAVMWVCGTALVLGIGNRIWAILAGLVWVWALLMKGAYMFTYANYLGEAIAIYLLPYQRMSIDFLLTNKHTQAKRMKHERYSMPITRVLFGFSLLYTAITVKFMDTALSLDVVNHYNLTRFFPFDPLFVVLGAALIELLVSLLIITGLLQRFTAVLFLAVMTLSLIFFKESVWPHYLLIGLGAGVFLHRPDMWSLDTRLAQQPQFKTMTNSKKQH
jgi:uncharacterized membrane protein YphA (DoxX/SURF4 family)